MVKALSQKCDYLRPFGWKSAKPYRCVYEDHCEFQRDLGRDIFCLFYSLEPEYVENILKGGNQDG